MLYWFNPLSQMTHVNSNTICTVVFRSTNRVRKKKELPLEKKKKPDGEPEMREKNKERKTGIFSTASPRGDSSDYWLSYFISLRKGTSVKRALSCKLQNATLNDSTHR